MSNSTRSNSSLRVNPEAFYEPLFDSAGEGIILVDQKGDIVLANVRMTQLFGYSKEEFQGSNVSILIPEIIRERHKEHMRSYFSDPHARSMGKGLNLAAARKDGTQFPVEISLNHFENNGERFAIALVTDISQRKKNHDKILELNELLERKVKERTEQLAESQRLYSAIARNFPEGTINVFDRDLNYIFVEGKELYKLGVTNEILMGSNYLDRLPKEVGEMVKIYLDEVFEGTSCTFQVEINKNYYELDAVPLATNEGDIRQILVVEKNITKNKAVENEIRKALEKEKELNNLKSRFVSMASHEFRTPLGTILSSVSLIGRYTKSEDQAKRDKHIDRIKYAINTLTNILNDFLSLEKLEAGKVKVKAETFDLKQLCESLIEDYSGVLKTGQEFSFSCEESRVEVFLDKQMLSNAILNLLTNASKYSDGGSTIWLTLTSTAEAIVIEVKDEGIGIPEDEQHHLFERFFRAQNVTNIQGTGLGLNIVKKYVEIMGGSISFESLCGVGSAFQISLPKITK